MTTDSNQKPDKREFTNSTGFSSRVLSYNHRLLKKDGSFNIDTRGLPWFRPSDAFQKLIQMSWTRFIAIVLASYLAVNTFFAFLYFITGTEHLTHTSNDTQWNKFVDAFFFSSQSITTVGYGRVAPIGIESSSIAALESMIGLLGFALATGLLYGRFSRPNAKLLYSENVLITPYDTGTACMFRVANKRESQMVDVDLQVTYKRNANENGKEFRQFIPLKLESHHMNMFPLTWTVVHAITPESPMWGKTLQDFIDEDMELLIYFKGYDETFSNNVHYRISYKASELIWGARFILNFEEIPNGPTIHYLNRINEYEEALLPEQEK